MRSILSILIAISTICLMGQVPAGGSMLNATTGSTWQNFGKGSLTEVSISGQSFSTALQMTIGSDINNSWDSQINFPAVAGVSTGDVVLVAFWGRTISSGDETGLGQLTVCIEEKTSYAKQLYYNITIGTEWKQYFAPVEIKDDLEVDQIRYLFQMGFEDQVVQVAEVKYLNYKDLYTLSEMPVTELTYQGQAPDAAWRADAAARIEAHRKGSLELEVRDDQGQLIEGAEVEVEMLRHDFGWGSAVAASQINSNENYREKLYDMFNEVVFENDLKWKQFQNSSSHAGILSAMDSLDAQSIPIRGHNIIWPAWRWLPTSLEELAGQPEALRAAIDQHFDEVQEFTKGRLNDWDVMNEPYSEHDIQDILGDEVMADWFARARRNDPGVKLYINDYSIISGGGKNQTKQDYYYQLIQDIESWGGEIDGIGMQGHFGSELTSIDRVWEILERFAALGKEIKITEFDIDLENQPGVQADYTRDFMTLMFSHPSVRAVLVWGFWEGRHWRPDAAFFNEDWSMRPHGAMWRQMIREEWWTPQQSLQSDADGKAGFEGFLGTYSYTIRHDGQERSGTFELEHSNHSGEENRVILSLDELLPEQLLIQPDREGHYCIGQKALLSCTALPEGHYYWIKGTDTLDSHSSSIEVSEGGAYQVELHYQGQVLRSPAKEVVFRESPGITLDHSGLSVCYGEEVLFEAASEDTDLELEWYQGGTRVQLGELQFTAGEPGQYRLEVTRNACTSVLGPYTVTMSRKDEVVIEAMDPLKVCEGASVSLRTQPVPGESYTWEHDGEVIEESHWMVTVSESGSYHVTHEQDGCLSSSDTLEVEVHPLPLAELSLEGEPEICQGDFVRLQLPEQTGVSYSWARDGSEMEETGRSLEAGQGGSYTGRVSNEACSVESDPVIVEVLSESDSRCATGIGQKELMAAVHPNPFRGAFTLRLQRPAEQNTEVHLFNLAGAKVLSRQIEAGEQELSMEWNEKGVFVLQINAGGQRSYQKIVSN